MLHVGFVNKYAARTVATHILKATGRPACGARVDRDALETYEGAINDVTCARCLRSTAGHGAAVAEGFEAIQAAREAARP